MAYDQRTADLEATVQRLREAFDTVRGVMSSAEHAACYPTIEEYRVDMLDLIDRERSAAERV